MNLNKGTVTTKVARKPNQLKSYVRGQQKMEENSSKIYFKLSIPPTLRELKFTTPPVLSKIILKGGYENVSQYLDIHFKLLREDFIRPLRQSLRNYLQFLFHEKRKQTCSDNLNFYRGVKITQKLYRNELDGNDYYIICFGESYLQNGNQINFKPGSLLCLSKDGFKSMNIALIRYIKNLSEKLRNGEVVAVMGKEEFPEEWSSVQSWEFIALKSSAYFEAYFHVLRSLKMIDPKLLPLKDHVIFSKLDILPPGFLTKDVVFNLTCLKENEQSARKVESDDETDSSSDESLSYSSDTSTLDEMNPENAYLIPILESSCWSSSSSLGLDDSQVRALQLTFSHSVALIQGPPGTGKSFLGLKLIHAFLANRKRWWREKDPRPILVVSLTNHALDQFLEKLLGVTKKLVRFGSRSQSKLLEKYNYKHLVELQAKSKELSCAINEMETQLKNLDTFLHKSKSHILSEDLLLVPPSDVILKNQLLTIGNKPHYTSAPLYDWLGLTFHRDICDDLLSLLESQIIKKEKHKNGDVQEMNNNTLNITQEIEAVRFQLSHRLRKLDKYDLIEIVDLDRIFYHFTAVKDFGNELNHILKEKAKKKQEMAKKELLKVDKMSDEEVMHVEDVWMLPSEDRWRLYRRWAGFVYEDKMSRISTLKHRLGICKKEWNNISIWLKNNDLSKRDIIGMTTTGAAKNWELLQEVGCQIVVVEEAAKTLESHVICSLNPKTKHLILIGDHQQLRPQVAVQHLAKEYNLDVSLFERLIMNGFPFAVLRQQHRMRPEISRIIRRHFYPNLQDHPSVNDYPPVRGIKKSVFFLNASSKEEEVHSPTVTYKNMFEAKFVVALFQYLLKQGYSRAEITILTTYSGQLLALQSLLNKVYNKTEDIEVATVDSYQGKENEIVLLSLVRSNRNGTIGFMAEKNRMNVAFSRARQGFYVIGNLSFLAKNSHFWGEIYAGLTEDDIIGPSLELYCQNHPSIIHKVAWSEEFSRVSPDGGCRKACGEYMKCGHNCRLKCHVTPHKCFANIKKCLPCGHEIWLSCKREDTATKNCRKCSSKEE